jgi:ACR3 family arsenite efflux pump ArsB
MPIVTGGPGWASFHGAWHPLANFGCSEPSSASRRSGTRIASFLIVDAFTASSLLATLVLLFGFQGEQILAQQLILGLLAVPILIQVYFNSGLAYLLNRISGEPVMLSVVWIVNRSKGWYENGRATTRLAEDRGQGS